ncbi:MAG: SIS domain-containing protein [Clostridia bacterium]|nr:SIS domain-containing protein [Clostridia bacterium]
MLNIILQELKQTAESIPADAIRRCADKIAAHERIFVYGAGRSGLMLRALAMRLMQLGKTVYVVGETITPSIQKGDLLIVASASGATHSVCHYAAEAVKMQADLLIITAEKESELARIAPPDVIIPAPTKHNLAASGQLMGSLFEQMILLFSDAVTMALAENRETLSRNHANLE